MCRSFTRLAWAQGGSVRCLMPHGGARDVPVVMVPAWLVTCCACSCIAAALMAQVLVSIRMRHGVYGSIRQYGVYGSIRQYVNVASVEVQVAVHN